MDWQAPRLNASRSRLTPFKASASCGLPAVSRINALCSAVTLHPASNTQKNTTP